jgi:hypothetical protein
MTSRALATQVRVAGNQVAGLVALMPRENERDERDHD